MRKLSFSAWSTLIGGFMLVGAIALGQGYGYFSPTVAYTFSGANTFSGSSTFSEAATFTKDTGGTTTGAINVTGTLTSNDVGICLNEFVQIRGCNGSATGNVIQFSGTNTDVSQNLTVAGTGTFSQGIKLGGGSAPTIDDSFAGSATIDFASTTNTTADSANVTVTGAAVGDTCTVGVPVAAQVAGASFTCFITATNVAVVRLTATGAAIDPASGTFTVRTFDP